MLCSLSGLVAEHPVVSPRSGRIFERQLLEKHIAALGTDPISGDPLRVEELVSVVLPAIEDQTAPVPRLPEAASVPVLLKALQNEWDAAALEVFNLRKQLADTRKELAQLLYQHDAACRVIARLSKERDEAIQLAANNK
jgi:pre-mRNA-processing factor 19